MNDMPECTEIEYDGSVIVKPFIMIPEMVLEMLDEDTISSLQKGHEILVCDNNELRALTLGAPSKCESMR